MKHLLLLLGLLCVGYAAWHFMARSQRRAGVRLLSRHGLRIGAMVAVVLALLALAYYSTSIRIL